MLRILQIVSVLTVMVTAAAATPSAPSTRPALGPKAPPVVKKVVKKVVKMNDDKAWTDGEAAVRKALNQAKVTPKEIRHSPGANVLVFGITTSDDKALYASASGGVVHLSTAKHSDAVVESILKAEDALERSDLNAADIILIVHAFGTAPATIQKTLDNSTTGRAVVPGHPPTWTATKDGGHLEIFALRNEGRRGAEAKPMDHLHKGILTVSRTYKITWRVESVDLPTSMGFQ